MLADARAKVERTIAEAKRQAADLMSSTRKQLAEEHERTRVGAEQVRQTIEELRRFRSEYRDRVREIVAEQLGALDRVGDLPELPPVLDGMADAVKPESLPEAAAAPDRNRPPWPGSGGSDNSAAGGQPAGAPWSAGPGTRRFDRRPAESLPEMAPVPARENDRRVFRFGEERRPDRGDNGV